MLRAWAGVGHRLTELGGDVVQAVDASVQTDGANAARVGRAADQR
ncbi:hypothetical protein NKG94_28955 [Micromonospora sp. M12]